MIMHHSIRSLGAALAVVASLAAQAAWALDNGTGASDDDCYNRATRECNAKYPRQDYGDAQYKKCIDDGLDACDENEPVELHPGRLGFDVIVPTTRFFMLAR